MKGLLAYLIALALGALALPAFAALERFATSLQQVARSNSFVGRAFLTAKHAFCSKVALISSSVKRMSSCKGNSTNLCMTPVTCKDFAIFFTRHAIKIS